MSGLALVLAGGVVTHNADAQTDTGRPVVILVHGRGLIGLPADSVRTAWKQSLQEGLARIGFTAIGKDDVSMAWYGSASMNFYCDEMASSFNTDRRSLVQRLAELVAKIPGIEQIVGRATVEDTQAYFSDGCYRGQVDFALRAELDAAKREQRPVILVAHSMGSLVAFAVLSQEWVPTDDESVAFITIGSMLGMEEMPKALLGAYVTSPVPVPQVITHWINVRNDGDLLSFATRGRFRSRVPARIPVDTSVKAVGVSHHSADTYLRDPVVAKIIANSWCDAFATDARPTDCSR